MRYSVLELGLSGDSFDVIAVPLISMSNNYIIMSTRAREILANKYGYRPIKQNNDGVVFVGSKAHLQADSFAFFLLPETHPMFCMSLILIEFSIPATHRKAASKTPLKGID